MSGKVAKFIDLTTANDTLELINFFETVNTSYEVNGAGSQTVVKADVQKAA